MQANPTSGRIGSGLALVSHHLRRAVLRAGFLLAGLCLVATVASAQGTGTISGRVLNVTNGQYVKNARITVEGTGLQAITGEFGEYRLTGVPVGAARVRADYGGMSPVTQTVTLAAGGDAEQNFNLGAGAAAAPGEVIRLDEVVVAETRETNAAAIATNEQRYAPNMKSVVSSDAFGDANEGNVGEFLKYLPGITVDYVAADVRTIAVGGFASNFTGVNVNGNRMASSNSGNTDRVFELEQVSINNIARAEVTRVPTADQPMDTLGGAVNLVSKSAFEQAHRSFVYKTSVNIHSENRDDLFRRTPGPGNNRTFKNLPGFEFTYTNPLSDRLGIVITGISSNQFNEQHRSATTWNYNATGTGASPTNPFVSNYQIQDGPKNSYRDSTSFRVDWKAARNHVFSLGAQVNYYKSFFGNRNLNFATGTNATPTPATGTPLLFDRNFTQGATGRGTVTQGLSFRDKMGTTQAFDLAYRYTGRSWEADAGASASNGRTWYRDQTRGHFENVTTTMQGVSTGTVRIEGIGYPGPANFVVKDSTGTALDPYNLANFRINTVVSRPVDGEATNQAIYANALKRFYPAGISMSLKTGLSIRSEDRDNRRVSAYTYTFVGADGVANTADDSALAYLDTRYLNVDPYWGSRPIQWVSPFRVYEAYKANPNYFQATAAQAVANETNRINGSEKYSEVITATYLQAEANMWKNRFKIVAGWRYEKTHDKGQGPLVDPDAPFQRNADGTFVVVNGARVRKPEAGTAGSMEELRLVRKERQGLGNRNYDGIYPSINSTLVLRENFQVRFAFAKTFGRPNFTDLVPNTTIDEADSTPAPGTPPGTVTARNPALKPWTGNNYDLGFEYYFNGGGSISVYGSQKNLTNFWNSVSTTITPDIASEVGIDPAYVGWTLNTKLNGGRSKISGLAIDYNQPLDFIPKVGRFLYLRAHVTRLHLEGEHGADFTNFIPRAGNIGLTYNRRPINIKLNYNYRGPQRLSTQTAINGFQYYAERKYFDLNAEYTFSKRMTLFLNGRNITNYPQDRVNLGNNVDYSRLNQVEEFGVQWALGIKGQF
jgi:iron complex outermembrane receptor protein